MKYLKIQNDGLLDIRLVALMGGTTKSKNVYKIGRFGTGLKYTLAFLFRNNIKFKIFVGHNEVKIGLDHEEIQGETFEIITINGQRTSITTKMGEDWQAWMIIRELWCNALDEGGAEKEVVDNNFLQGMDYKTTFYIELNPLIESVVDDWGKYFIHDQEPLMNEGNIAIYPGGDSLKIYKQGVLIYEDRESPAVLSYDFKDAEINELREYKGNRYWIIPNTLMKADEIVAAYFLDNVTDNHYEEKYADLSWISSKFNISWANVIGARKIVTKETYKKLEERGVEMNNVEILQLPQRIFKGLTDSFDNVSLVKTFGNSGEFYEAYDKEADNKVMAAVILLEECNYNINEDIIFKFGTFEKSYVNAKLDINEKTLFLSNKLSNFPVQKIAAILVEENEHYNTGFEDESREFQQHFIDLYTNELLSKNQIEI